MNEMTFFIMQTFLLLVAVTLCIAHAHGENGHTPGETYPETVEEMVGASFNISCRMNPIVFPGLSASDLYFIDTRTQQIVPNSDIDVLDVRTIVYMVRNAPEQQTSYLCKCGADAIMDTKVYVGTPPRLVRDFGCRSYDFEYMVCNFTQPPNPVLTQYNLTFYTHSRAYNYNPICNYEEKPLVVCNTTLMHKYRPHVEYYHFRLRAVNGLGTRTQDIVANNLDVMVPAMPGEDFRIMQLSTDAVQVAWRMPKWDFYKSKGLQWEVLLQPDHFEEIDLSTKVAVVRTRNELQLRINELPYAYYWYELRLRVKVRTAAAIDSMWSAQFRHRFRSAARRPDRPPLTDVGSFYVDSSETQLRLYWEELLPSEYNGYNFTYSIAEVRKDGSPIELAPLHLELNLAIFSWQKTSQYEFTIRSRNHIGESQDATRIVVYPLIHGNAKTHTPRAIHNVYHATNRTYTLTWEAPITMDGLQDYTVYWCYSKRALQNECKGSIHFKHLSRDLYKFTTDPQSPQQEHTLNLAVSANFADYNSGMHWTACTVDVNSDLVKMEPELQSISASSVKVHWSPESVCPSILVGYNLSYCEVASGIAAEQASCIYSVNHTIIDRNAKKLEINNLKPFTNYKVEMFMFSRMKVGKLSESMLVRTLEAAPTPPRQLQVSRILNSSATITWLPPSHSNGKIRFYIVILNNDKFPVAADPNDPSAKIVYQLQNLTSYTAYKVYVIAQTVESSHPSNDIHFTTLIGVPSMPGSAIPTRDTNNDTLIQWSKPSAPAGRVEYYEVAVTVMWNEEVVRRRISTIIGSTSCSLKIPACIDHEYKTTFEVRAVNAALLTHEVPTDDSTEQELRLDPEAEYYDGNDELICSGGRTQSVGALERYQDAAIYRLYKSPWQRGPTYGCSANRLSKITTIALLVVVLSLCVMLALYMARKKYNKMANINCTLPPGLDTYITKDGFGGDFMTPEKDDESPHMQRGGKEFVFHNEKHYLLASLTSDSGYLGEGHLTLGSNTNAAVDDPYICAGSMRTNSESSAAADSLVESTDSAEIDLDRVAEDLGMANHLQRIMEVEPSIEVAQALPMLQILPTNDNNCCYIKPTEVNNWHLPPAQKHQEDTVTIPTATSGYVTVDSICVPSVPSSQINPSGYVQSVELQTNPYTTLEQLEKANKVGGGAVGAAANDHEPNMSAANAHISGYVKQRDLTAFGQQQQFN